MKQYSYKWLSYNLNVGCVRCGNRMIFQSPEKEVECNDCGYKEKYNWKDVLSFVKVEDIKKYEAGSKILMGRMDVKSTHSPVSHINCYHCKAEVNIAPDADIKAVNCNDCKKPLEFEKITEDHIFYACKNGPEQNGPPTMVAVKCVSCGAPLEADPTKNNYHCKFCGTENILPPSMRFKVILNDTFLGLRKRFYQKELAFTGFPEEVVKAIKQHGVKNFTQEEVDTIVKTYIQMPHIYFEFYSNGGKISKEVEEEIFKVSKHRQQILITGQQTGKSQPEIDKRIQEVNPPAKSIVKPEQKEKKGFFRKLFG